MSELVASADRRQTPAYAPIARHFRAAAFRDSQETIDCAIDPEPRGGLRTEIVSLLRKSRGGRLPSTRGNARFTAIQNVISIAPRPPEVAARLVRGHRASDLIKGSGNGSALAIIVERTSRLILLVKLDRFEALSTLHGLTCRLRAISSCLRKTLTGDQGTEMRLQQTLTQQLCVAIFTRDPHGPWQRGSDENANGLTREYIPKGTDLATASDQQLRSIEYALNNRSRRIFGFKTYTEVSAELQSDHVARVALPV